MMIVNVERDVLQIIRIAESKLPQGIPFLNVMLERTKQFAIDTPQKVIDRIDSMPKETASARRSMLHPPTMRFFVTAMIQIDPTRVSCFLWPIYLSIIYTLFSVKQLILFWAYSLSKFCSNIVTLCRRTGMDTRKCNLFVSWSFAGQKKQASSSMAVEGE